MSEIKGFFGQYRFLSNFWLVNITGWDERVYPSNEHFFQAMKTVSDLDREWIQAQPTPGLAKQAGSPQGLNGQTVILRRGWDEMKDQVMIHGLRVKFSHSTLGQLLLETGDAHLEETNSWKDTYWGVCNGVGENKLGRLLMQVRDELR